MDWRPIPRCSCPCHTASVLPWAAPPVTDPLAALEACDLCHPLHRGVWSVYKRPRVTKRWVDPEPPA